MKHLIYIIVLIGFTYSSYSQEHDFKITITNIKLNKGKVFVAISNSKKNWLENAYKTIAIKSDSITKTITFSIPFDKYGIAVYQDTIQNNEPDMNFLGAPKEPVAFGNNYKPFLGEPKFRKASVLFDKNYKQQILKLF